MLDVELGEAVEESRMETDVDGRGDAYGDIDEGCDADDNRNEGDDADGGDNADDEEWTFEAMDEEGQLGDVAGFVMQNKKKGEPRIMLELDENERAHFVPYSNPERKD